MSGTEGPQFAGTPRKQLTERDVRTLRMLGYLAAFLLTAFGFLHAWVGSGVYDPPILRAAVVAMCLLFATATLFYRDDRVMVLVYVAFYVVTLWLIYLVWANRLLPDYSLSLILVVAGACTGFRHRGVLTWYCVMTVAGAALAGFLNADPLLKPGLFTAQIMAITLIAYVIGSGRITMQRELTESQHTLLEQQRSMATLLRNLPGMAYRCRIDAGWTMELASEGSLALTGYSSDALVGNAVVAFGDLIHPADRVRIRTETDEAVARRLPFHLEYRIITAAGEEKWLSERGQPVLDADGTVALEGFISDISEEKRTLEAVRRSARESQLLVDVFRTCALETDEERITQQVTEALQSFFGAWSLAVYFADEDGEALLLTGLALADPVPELMTMIRRLWARLPLCGDNPLRQVFRTGTAVDGHADDPDLGPDVRRFLSAAGFSRYHVIPIVAGSDIAGVAAFSPGEQELDPDASRLLDIALGHVALSMRANRLLEVRRRTLGRLRTLAAAVEQLPDAVTILDAHFNVQLANPAWLALSGQLAEQAYGAPLPAETGISRIPRLAVEHGGWTGERPLRRPDGAVLPISISATPVYDENGGLTGVVQIARDVSGDKRLRAEQMRASRLAAIGELAAGVAHEVNNPLGAISMTAEMLLAQRLPGEAGNDVATILSEARRAGSIVRNLLAFARQEPGSKSPLQIGDVIAGVEKLKRGELAAANIDLRITVAPDLAPVRGDAQQLQQVLHNLLTNAQQAINGAGEGVVRIAAASRGDVVELVVEDSGPGIAESVQASLFVPFFTTKPFGEGTGLGLAISYGIVREHDGEIVAGNWGRPRVAGGAPGEGGARFIVRLPALTARSAADDADRDSGTPAVPDIQATADGDAQSVDPDAAASTAEGPQHVRVLVVDDEQVIARMVQRFLRGAGWTVDACGSAEEAIAMLQGDEPYDVVLSDVHMPGVGGRGLYDFLCASLPGAADRMVFMSGDVVSAETDAFLRRTGRPVLPKPFDLRALRAAALETLAAHAG